MANRLKETPPPSKPTPDTSDVTHKLLQQLINNNNSNNKDKNKTKTKIPQNTALYTPTSQTEGAVWTTVDNQEKWTATIMNTNPQIPKQAKNNLLGYFNPPMCPYP